MLILNEALKLRSVGLSVIPLCQPKNGGCTGCGEAHSMGHKIGKVPLLPWTQFQSRRASPDEVKEWVRKWPGLNVGVVTGEISNVIVLDLDGLKGLAWLAQQKVYSSVTVNSGSGGKHLWFKNDQSLRNSASKLAPGVDIRGEGGYVVVPPSFHPNGWRYRWGLTPDFSALSVVPTIILEGLRNAGTSVTASNDKNYVPKPEGWVSDALEEMKNGHIHNTLISVLGKFRSHNFSIEDTVKLLTPYAFENGKPYTALRNKVEEIWGRYEPKAGRIESNVQSTNGQYQVGLKLHTPSNPDSQQQYKKLLESHHSVSEFPTGYPQFDTLTGGLKRGEVLTVAARTGVGKTNWLIGPIRTLCEKGKKVLLFSTEMSFDQIWDRYRATLTTDDSFEQHQFYICDDFAPNLERIEEALKLSMPDVFMFDHANVIADDHQKLGEFMKGIKFLARKFNIPCILTAQLNRGADWIENGERIEPRLSMIKGSGTIEEVSAQVLLLNEKRVTLEGTEIEGVVAKNRHGDKGLILFILKKNPYRFTEA